MKTLVQNSPRLFFREASRTVCKYGVVTVVPKRGMFVMPSTLILHSDSLNKPLTAPQRVDDMRVKHIIHLPDDTTAGSIPKYAIISPENGASGIEWLDHVCLLCQDDGITTGVNYVCDAGCQKIGDNYVLSPKT